MNTPNRMLAQRHVVQSQPQSSAAGGSAGTTRVVSSSTFGATTISRNGHFGGQAVFAPQVVQMGGGFGYGQQMPAHAYQGSVRAATSSAPATPAKSAEAGASPAPSPVKASAPSTPQPASGAVYRQVVDAFGNVQYQQVGGQQQQQSLHRMSGDMRRTSGHGASHFAAAGPYAASSTFGVPQHTMYARGASHSANVGVRQHRALAGSASATATSYTRQAPPSTTTASDVGKAADEASTPAAPRSRALRPSSTAAVPSAWTRIGQSGAQEKPRGPVFEQPSGVLSNATVHSVHILQQNPPAIVDRRISSSSQRSAPLPDEATRAPTPTLEEIQQDLAARNIGVGARGAATAQTVTPAGSPSKGAPAAAAQKAEHDDDDDVDVDDDDAVVTPASSVIITPTGSPAGSPQRGGGSSTLQKTDQGAAMSPGPSVSQQNSPVRHQLSSATTGQSSTIGGQPLLSTSTLRQHRRLLGSKSATAAPRSGRRLFESGSAVSAVSRAPSALSGVTGLRVPHSRGLRPSASATSAVGSSALTTIGEVMEALSTATPSELNNPHNPISNLVKYDNDPEWQTVWVVRHAERMDEGHPETWAKMAPRGREWDPPITDLGMAQAEATAMFIASQPQHIDRIVASPALRTMQTAAVMARALGLQIQVDYSISESIYRHGFSKVPEWMSPAELDGLFPGLIDHSYRGRPPPRAIENSIDVYLRAGQFIRDLTTGYMPGEPRENVVVVTHGYMPDMCLEFLELKEPSDSGAGRKQPGNASVSKFELDTRRSVWHNERHLFCSSDHLIMRGLYRNDDGVPEIERQQQRMMSGFGMNLASGMRSRSRSRSRGRR